MNTISLVALKNSVSTTKVQVPSVAAAASVGKHSSFPSLSLSWFCFTIKSHFSEILTGKCKQGGSFSMDPLKRSLQQAIFFSWQLLPLSLHTLVCYQKVLRKCVSREPVLKQLGSCHCFPTRHWLQEKERATGATRISGRSITHFNIYRF